MTNCFIVLFGLMVVAGVAGAEPLVDGDVDAGKQKSAACAACHGPQGNMVSEQFPKLADQGSPYIYEQLKLYKSGDRQNAIMAGQVAGLNDQDMKDLAAYYASQQIKPGAADKTIAPAGATLYHAGSPDDDIPACSGCHGPSGLGNTAAKYPHLSGQNPGYVVAQLTAYREGNRSGYRNATIMNGVAQNLSDTNIKALASYVAGLQPAQENGKGTGTQYGALMQGAGTAQAASTSQESTPAEADSADAAAKDETGEAGGEQEQSEAKPAKGTGGVDAARAGETSAPDESADSGSQAKTDSAPVAKENAPADAESADAAAEENVGDASGNQKQAKAQPAQSTGSTDNAAGAEDSGAQDKSAGSDSNAETDKTN